MNLILPFRGEFGMKLMRHVPQVNAIPGEKIVCCEPGEEALYPSASQFEICAKNDDDKRRESYDKDKSFVDNYTKQLRKKYGKEVKFIKTDQKMPCKYFIPKPYVEFGIKTDIVVCPRKREYGAEKNWKHWPAFVKRLPEYQVFAAGAPDSSYDVDCPKAWDYPRCLDATLEAINSCKLVVATDNGIAHLAVQCGKPLLMITHKEGLVAPGPVRRGDGKIVRKQYFPVKIERFHKENHTGSRIHVLHHGWENLELVIEETLHKIQESD